MVVRLAILIVSCELRFTTPLGLTMAGRRAGALQLAELLTGLTGKCEILGGAPALPWEIGIQFLDLHWLIYNTNPTIPP